MKIPKKIAVMIGSCAGLAGFAAATETASAVEQPEIVSVKVASGDTLWRLAQDHNSPTSPADLATLNGVDPKALRPGTPLVVTSCGTMIAVSPGSTLVDIVANLAAAGVATSVAELATFNGITDPSVIMAGTCLRVPGVMPAFAAQAAPTAPAAPVAAVEDEQQHAAVKKDSTGSGPADTFALEASAITEDTACNGAPVDKVRSAYHFYRVHGLSRIGAAYLVGNLCQESTLRVDAVGDGGSAYGLAQWVGGRQDGMPSPDAPFEDHLAFVLLEMERDGDRNGHNVLEAVHGTDRDAIVKGLKRWERYGVEGRRYVFGQSIFEAVSQVPEHTVIAPVPAPVSVPAVTPNVSAVDIAVTPQRATAAPSAGRVDQASMVVRKTEGVTTINVDGIPVNIEIVDRLIAMMDDAKAQGVTLTLLSGFRSIDRQLEIGAINGCPTGWTDWTQCKILPTAPPSKSRHTKGLAVDFDEYDVEWLEENAARYGFYNYTGEPWHWSVDGH